MYARYEVEWLARLPHPSTPTNPHWNRLLVCARVRLACVRACVRASVVVVVVVVVRVVVVAVCGIFQRRSACAFLCRWADAPLRSSTCACRRQSACGALTTTVSVLEWFLNYYASVHDLEHPPIEFVARAGEVVFVPAGWSVCATIFLFLSFVFRRTRRTLARGGWWELRGRTQ